jgi:hypothetical protein
MLILTFEPLKRKESRGEKLKLFLVFGSLNDLISQEDIGFAELSDIKLFIVFIGVWSLR